LLKTIAKVFSLWRTTGWRKIAPYHPNKLRRYGCIDGLLRICFEAIVIIEIIPIIIKPHII